MNKNYKKRNQIIFGDEDANLRGVDIRHFKSLDLKQLEDLIQNDFIELRERQNFSPSTAEFLEFMRKYPDVRAHGYAVSHERDDYRVTLEGLQFRGDVSRALLRDFKKLCRGAEGEPDSCVAKQDRLYAWWD